MKALGMSTRADDIARIMDEVLLTPSLLTERERSRDYRLYHVTKLRLIAPCPRLALQEGTVTSFWSSNSYRWRSRIL